MKKSVWFISLFIFFSISIFFFLVYNGDKSLEYERYIDISSWDIKKEYKVSSLKKDNSSFESKNEEKQEIVLAKQTNSQIKETENLKTFYSSTIYSIDFFPLDFKDETKDYNDLVNSIVSSDFFSWKLNDLKIEFYKDMIDVRGKMKDKTVKMFWVKDLSYDEFNSVFIHELSHFVDLYSLEKKVFIDISDYFYDISWDSTKVIRWWQKQSDFVSGYAMTNKYEDFAESFTYYVLHNNDFLEKSKKSSVLEKKYNFFRNYIFRNNEFVKTDFSLDNEILDYYWDITKIEINSEKFLQYLKN